MTKCYDVILWIYLLEETSVFLGKPKYLYSFQILVLVVFTKGLIF